MKESTSFLLLQSWKIKNFIRSNSKSSYFDSVPKILFRIFGVPLIFAPAVNESLKVTGELSKKLCKKVSRFSKMSDTFNLFGIFCIFFLVSRLYGYTLKNNFYNIQNIIYFLFKRA